MNKEQLLEAHDKRRATGERRLNVERAMIEGLPEGVDVEKVYSRWPVANARVNGFIELSTEVEDVDERLRLFPPLPLSRVGRIVADKPATSFHPTKQILESWRDDENCQVTDEIYPALLQIRPASAKSEGSHPLIRPCTSEVEWYYEPEENFIIHMRATLVDAAIRYERGEKHEWVAHNVPRGSYRRALMDGPAEPPLITVWWHETEIGESLLEVLHGPGREI